MKRNDLYLLGAVIVAALIIMFAMRATKDKAERFVIRVDGELFGEYPADSDADITIEGFDGGLNRLIIKDGKADIVEADCPDKLCVHQSAISLKGESLVCLPHRVIVTVEGGKEGSLDAITR